LPALGNQLRRLFENFIAPGLPAVILSGGDSKEKASPSADWLMARLFLLSGYFPDKTLSHLTVYLIVNINVSPPLSQILKN